MAFTDLQLVDADDLNNFAPSGNVTIGGTLGVTGATTLAALSATTIAASSTITATGGKVAFPASQSASADANTLDDYEEGTYSAVIGGAGGTSGQTYGTQTGRYIKIGQFVCAEVDLTLTAKGTITGQAMISLPFTVAATCGANMVLWENTAVAVGVLMAQPVTSTSYALLYKTDNVVTSVQQVTTGQIANNTRLAATICYRADA
jgi:hypothetical protein